MTDRLYQQLAFIREADKMKGILRANMMLDGTRQEDDAQHSWHIALMALVLSEYARPGVDIDRAMRMLLVHDMVEIDAGDTYAYDEVAGADKRERECAAAQRIFGMLPQNQGDALRMLWEEFEACQTPSAQYANAIDRLQPLLGNFWVDGKVWEENRITLEKVLTRNEITKTALPGIWDSVRTLLDEAVARGYLR
jgi:putative hydrolase of HD superfamily